MNPKFKTSVIIICIAVAVIYKFLVFSNDKASTVTEVTVGNTNIDTCIIDTVIIKPLIKIDTLQLSILNVQKALEHYNIQYPDIVLAQSILETGYYQSYVCLEYNNLFGLYDSKNKDYYKFNHWSDSIKGYISYVQRKYKPSEDYYTFLQELPYAMDPDYISKIKLIVEKNENSCNR